MKLVGLTEKEAIKALRQAGKTYRIVSQDGKAGLITADVVFHRCNLTIENGVVTRATFG
jgi:hypothetical protein